MVPRPRHFLTLAVLALLAGNVVRAQLLGDYDEYYRLMRINALEQFSFSYPTRSPEHEPSVVGVRRDSLNRPVEIAGFFFGNPDTRGDWTVIRIEYLSNPRTGSSIQRRTYYGPHGVPITIGWAHGEEVFTDSTGALTMRREIGLDDKPLSDVPAVTSTLYHRRAPGEYTQEWFYGRGKQHFGAGTDGPQREFAELPDGAYFRHFKVGANGNLIAEALWNLMKKPMAFPGGEFVRRYTLNSSGLPIRVDFYDEHDQPVADRDGIAAETYKYDNYGRVIEWRGLNLDGGAAARSSDGAARIEYNYRAHDGVLLSEDHFDVKGQPIE